MGGFKTHRGKGSSAAPVLLWWHIVFKWRAECSCQRPGADWDWQLYYSSRSLDTFKGNWTTRQAPVPEPSTCLFIFTFCHFPSLSVFFFSPHFPFFSFVSLPISRFCCALSQNEQFSVLSITPSCSVSTQTSFSQVRDPATSSPLL